MTIPSEWYQKLKEDVVIPARTVNIARKVAAVRGPLGLGVQQYDFDTLSEMSVADLTFSFGITGSEDSLNFTRSSVKVPVIQKDFRIDRRDVASAERFGLPLKTEAAQAAAYQVTYAENSLVLVGDSTTGINGLYNSANNTESTSLDFGTYGNALQKVRAAMALLMADNIYPPYNLLLHPTQYAELYGSIDTSAGGSVDEAARVKAMIGGDIIVCPYLTAGTGLLAATPEQRKFEIIVAQDLTVEASLDAKKNIKGFVFECVVPVVYDTNALCKLTNI